MNDFDQALTMGFAAGAFASAMLWLSLKIARSEKPEMPGTDVWPEEPLRPLRDEDLRVVRICDACRRYMGSDRTLRAGQHVGIKHDLCPFCAKKAAVNSIQTA